MAPGQGINWGIRRGLAIAAVFVLWASCIYAIQGEVAFTHKHTTYLNVVVAYLGIGAVAGAIVGGLYRFATSEGWCLLIGFAAGLPVSVGITIAVYGLPQTWPASSRLFIPVYSVAAGLFIGNELNKARRRQGVAPLERSSSGSAGL